MAGGDPNNEPCRACGERKKYRRHVPVREHGYIVFQRLCADCIQERLYGKRVSADGRMGNG